MRQIDADELKAKFVKTLCGDDEYMDGWTFKSYAQEEILPIIDEAPTVAGEPDVRCGDCIHFNDGDCTELPKMVSEADYCSWGERRRRLIDAEALKTHVRFVYKFTDEKEYKLLVDMIENAPTIDAVEIVRCKDCKYAFAGNFFKGLACKKYPKNNTDVTTVKDDHFCAYGERSKRCD